MYLLWVVTFTTATDSNTPKPLTPMPNAQMQRAEEKVVLRASTIATCISSTLNGEHGMPPIHLQVVGILEPRLIK